MAALGLKDPKATKDEIVQWIKEYFEIHGKGCVAVIGISGGKDSTVAAALCVEALGKDRVFGVLMPNGEQADINDAYAVVHHLDICYALINIKNPFMEMLSEIQKGIIAKPSEQAMVNLAPRLRMAALYFVAQCLPCGGRVVNTCNYSEDFVGYSTKFGDSAGDFSPLSDLTMHEVLSLGHVLDIPKHLVDKTPADGLCGKTDEDNLGFTYEQLDLLINNGTSGNENVDQKIMKMYKQSRHKVLPMLSFRRYEK